MRPIDADELLKQQYRIGFGQVSVVSVDAIEKAPTLTPPNEPLPVLVNDEPHREHIDYICPRCKDTSSHNAGVGRGWKRCISANITITADSVWIGLTHSLAAARRRERRTRENEHGISVHLF